LLDANSVEIGSNTSGQTTIIGNLKTIDENFNVGWGMTTNIPVQTSSGSYVMQFINGLLIDPYHYAGSSGSGTSGSTSGSGVDPIPPSSGSLVLFSTDMLITPNGNVHESNPPEVSYIGNGVIEYAYGTGPRGDMVAWYFEHPYTGVASTVGSVRMDWEYISGTMDLNAPNDNSFIISCAQVTPIDHVYPFETWGTYESVSRLSGISPSSLHSWIGGLSGQVFYPVSGTIIDNGTYSNHSPMPNLTNSEDRWFAVQIWGYPRSTCRWQIKKLYIRPPGGDGSTDVIIFNFL
jgi:hypothetical protein